MATNAQALVTVTFTDGTRKEYPVTAHKGIAARLNELMCQTQALSLWNDERSFGIPRERIHEWEIRDLTDEERRVHAGDSA